MNPEDLSRILDELGERLGPTGSHVFELAVRQVYIEAAVAAVTLILTIALGVIAGPRLYRWQQDDRSGSSDRGFVALILALVYSILLVIVIPMAYLYIPNALNPEYAAIRSLLSALGGTL